MLCLYHRRSKRVEVQELAYPIPPAPAISIKDVWWQADSIGGKPVVSGSEVTLMLGGDGKVGGKSGCNGYDRHNDGLRPRADGSGTELSQPAGKGGVGEGDSGRQAGGGFGQRGDDPLFEEIGGWLTRAALSLS